ncbi:MAG: hypothetical protein H0V54_04660 [Chthoniobacterales bacterium]|nr:hypothetical protein [Chthoniobacterales bacterium]
MTTSIRVLNVAITETTDRLMSAEARRLGIDVSSLGAAILNGYFGDGGDSATTNFAPAQLEPDPEAPSSFADHRPPQPLADRAFLAPSDQYRRDLMVAHSFRNYPPRSLKFAQELINEALLIPEVTATRKERGVMFWPPFFRILYLRSYRTRHPGVVAAFYGEPAEFDDPKNLLRGGPKSYSRMAIESEKELAYALPFIHAAYARRYGKEMS